MVVAVGGDGLLNEVRGPGKRATGALLVQRGLHGEGADEPTGQEQRQLPALGWVFFSPLVVAVFT